MSDPNHKIQRKLYSNMTCLVSNMLAKASRVKLRLFQPLRPFQYLERTYFEPVQPHGIPAIGPSEAEEESDQDSENSADKNSQVAGAQPKPPKDETGLKVPVQNSRSCALLMECHLPPVLNSRFCTFHSQPIIRKARTWIHLAIRVELIPPSDESGQTAPRKLRGMYHHRKTA